ncbi:enoyl-CoA hydratase-related protein, partial [bacterium]|nr:enoyl-CoA hydratase-related protein [bacterium]
MKGNGITVHYAKSVAIIAMDYGFNVLSYEFVSSLHEEITRALEYVREKHAKAVVLHGNDRAFSAGASLFEIRSWLLSKENPEAAIRKGLGSLHDLMDRVTGLTAPVVT